MKDCGVLKHPFALVCVEESYMAYGTQCRLWDLVLVCVLLCSSMFYLVVKLLWKQSKKALLQSICMSTIWLELDH